MNQETKEKRRLSSKQWRLDNPERFKKAVRKHHLIKNYGITPEEYDDLLVKQEGKCAICDVKDPEIFKSDKKPRKNFSIDHCHKSGKIRGLLCHKCNTGLASFKDSPLLLESALAYLEENGY